MDNEIQRASERPALTSSNRHRLVSTSSVSIRSDTTSRSAEVSRSGRINLTGAGSTGPPDPRAATCVERVDQSGKQRVELHSDTLKILAVFQNRSERPCRSRRVQLVPSQSQQSMRPIE